MRHKSHLFRLSATVALSALVSNTALPLAAAAQSEPPPLAQITQNQSDPPSRVGRVASLGGTVSFRTLGDTQWSRASTNYPVASGNVFWTEPSAAANLQVSASLVALAGATEFDVTILDPSGLQAVAPQGETYFHLRDLAPNEMWSVQTPRGLVRMGAAGHYDIIVGTTDQPTQVTVLDGAAEVEAPGLSLQIAANQTATMTGTDPFQGSVGPALRSPFLTARLNAERPPRPAVAIPAPVAAQVAAMPGGEDLTDYGSWAPAPQYGQVWYPPVSPGWVPYREGHWAYVAPWGWTWVDDARWGFAPFHYGRWVRIDSRWGWTPGEAAATEPPVYAPALVTFLGIGAGIAVGAGLGAALAGGSVGWVPLGPREAYHPWYHASEGYVRQVNVSHVTNITNVTTINNYTNRAAATSMPAAAMSASRPVQAMAQPMTPQQFAAAQPVIGQQPIRPTAATVGVTPAVARQLNLAPVGTGASWAAPGTVVRAQAVGPANVAPARPALIGLHGAQADAPHAPPAAVPAPVGLPMGLPRRLPAALPVGSPAGAHEPGRLPALPTVGTRPAGVPVSPAGRAPGAPRVETPRAVTSNPAAGPQGAARPATVLVPAYRTPAGVQLNATAHVEQPNLAPHSAAPAAEFHAVPSPHVVAPAAPRTPPPVAPRIEVPRPVAPRVEVPQQAPPRVEAPRVVAPRVEAPTPMAPRVQAPQPVPQRIEAPRPAPPRPEAARPPPQAHAPPAERGKRPGEP